MYEAPGVTHAGGLAASVGGGPQLSPFTSRNAESAWYSALFW